MHRSVCRCLFFFNDTATTEIYTLSLHDALPISVYALASVFILSPLALLVAVAIRSFVVPTAVFKSFYRIVFFLPFITSFVVIALMFNLVFNNEFGLLNNALSDRKSVV